MPKADSKITTEKPLAAQVAEGRSLAPSRSSWDDPADWPEDLFCSRLDGSCLEPVVPDRAVVVFKKSESVRAGDFVGVWFKPERLAPGSAQSVVKRLKMDLPPRFTGGNAEGVVFLELLNPPECFGVKFDSILAIHKAIGYVPPGVAIGAKIRAKDVLPIGGR